jgi:hypothetical protein
VADALREQELHKILELLRSDDWDEAMLSVAMMDQLKPNIWEKMQFNYNLRLCSDWLVVDFEEKCPRDYIWTNRTWESMVLRVEKILYERANDKWFHLMSLPF